MRAREKNDLDFKGFVKRDQLWDLASDVAAFANAMGGVILVGVTESDGHDIVDVHGIRGQTFAEVQAAYEKAAADFCSPSISLSTIPIERDGLQFAAVHIDPFEDQMVGARAPSRNKTGAEVVSENGWVFPIRAGGRNTFVSPTEMVMHMNRQVRRSVLMLNRIPANERNRILLFSAHQIGLGSNFGSREDAVRFDGVDLERNGAVFSTAEGNGRHELRLPLRAIGDVWYEGALWCVRVLGEIRTGTDVRYQYRPWPPNASAGGT